MFLTQAANVIYDSLLSLAYPQVCGLCSSSVENRVYGSVCLACWQATRLFTGDESICWKCGDPVRGALHRAEPETIRCHKCDSQLFEAARACGIYEGALRESVLQLKREPKLARYIIEQLIEAGKLPPLDRATRIIPVPLHPIREQQRGFNQASLIARAIGPSLRLIVDESSLIRVIASHKYRAGLDAKGRLDTVADAFAVQFPQLIAGEIILLVDDVFTTGATASSCAAALLCAGAKSVLVLTLARPGR